MARHLSPVDILSPSPPPQPLTKRDVRRNKIIERLESMIGAFGSNQNQHYCAQLQAIQVDMTLVLRADPYEHGPLEDGGKEIEELVRSVAGKSVEGLSGDAKRDFDALAGRRFAEFTREVNVAMEERDANLTALHNNYHSSRAELDRTTQYKLELARREHAALESTVRQRLIASISKKKQLLQKDKEQLDIADSNAMLLHPNQFTINHPGSPSNGLQNRKTRHLRHHRATSPETGGGGGGNGKKRKAAVLGEDDGNESGAPALRPPPDNLGGGRSPFRDARKHETFVQYEAPAYSLERIFTDKELGMATQTAQLAAYRYFHTPAPSASPAVPSPLSNDASANADDTPLAPKPAATPPLPPAAAPDMERTTSHQVLTRHSARANPLAALTDLATTAAATQATPRAAFAPALPNTHAVARSEKAGAPPPQGADTYAADHDMALMLLHGAGDGAGGPEARRALLAQGLAHATAKPPGRFPLLEEGAAVIGRGVERLAASGFAAVAGVGVGEWRGRERMMRVGEVGSRATSSDGCGEEGAGRTGRRLI